MSSWIQITGWQLYLGIVWIVIGVAYAAIGARKLLAQSATDKAHD